MNFDDVKKALAVIEICNGGAGSAFIAKEIEKYGGILSSRNAVKSRYQQ